MQEKNVFYWPHKDLLDIDQLSQLDIYHVLNTASSLDETNSRVIKKLPTLRGKNIILFFAEPSTRTKVSFEIAGKRLSADTIGINTSSSSLQKGESLKDTALILQAMSPDAIVLRHSSSGAALFLADYLKCSVINAGDGWHAHPTQALLDVFSLWKVWGNSFHGKEVVIVGDTAHSRVCRSNVTLLNLMGVNVRLCSPRTLLPPGVEHWPVEIYTDLHQAICGVDAVICLRIQLERHKKSFFPGIEEYSKRFCLTPKHLMSAKTEVKVLHPGPFLQGVDLAPSLIDSPQSLIFDQVSAGVAIRMAILFLFLTCNDL